MESTPIITIGEKRIIKEFIKPFFNPADDPDGVGDDCAMVEFGDEVALLSTDRVPSNLTAFKLGILDFKGLGDYVARLNLSDIAACGGRPVGLLLNLGLPGDLDYGQVQSLCRGFRACAERHNVKVLGGDITDSLEISISATSIGTAKRGQVLTRRGAKAGDSIFVSRPIGLSPLAFYIFNRKEEMQLSTTAIDTLRMQFTSLEPMFELGQTLAKSGLCGACMDNTDGIGQSLTELSDASHCSMIINANAVTLHPVVIEACKQLGLHALDFLFDGGADFSLIGTLRGKWTSEQASEHLNHPLTIIGHVEDGTGVWLNTGQLNPLHFHGWNYFR